MLRYVAKQCETLRRVVNIVMQAYRRIGKIAEWSDRVGSTQTNVTLPPDQDHVLVITSVEADASKSHVVTTEGLERVDEVV